MTSEDEERKREMRYTMYIREIIERLAASRQCGRIVDAEVLKWSVNHNKQYMLLASEQQYMPLR
jgi:hypothetical protein